MIIKPYAAFGYVITLVTVDNNESWRPVQILSNDGSYKDNGYTYLYEGSARFINAQTNHEYPLRTVGWLSSEHYQDGMTNQGTVNYIPVGKTSWACISVFENKGKLPSKLEHIELPKGSSISTKNGTNVFLCKGDVSINDKRFNASGQIRIRTGDTIMIANEDSYILLFP